MPRGDEARPLVLSALLCLVIAAVSMVLTLLVWRDIGQVEAEILRLQERAAGCDAELALRTIPSRPPPPEDRVQRERPYLGDEGIDISAAMRVELQHLDGAQLRDARVGDPRILPPSTIQIVNLWAVWCSACKDEMPDFQRMLAAREAEWGESVRFVAVQVKDDSEPTHAYRSWSEMMPPETVRLADRGQDAPFVEALRGKPGKQPLFFDELPVTLVLDCNRRVRWAKFERLAEGDLRDLERHVDQLRAELAEDGEGARCRRQWCGNGRCEAGEGTAANACVEDCGARVRVVPPPWKQGPIDTTPRLADAPAEVATPEFLCPEHCARCTDDGRCIPKLQRASSGGDDPSPDPTAGASGQRCGDGECTPASGESTATCCADCGCPASFDCREGQDGRSCVPRLKP